MGKLRAWALACVALVLATVATNVVAPQPFGPAALGAIFEPYLVATALVVSLFAVRSMSRRRSALVVVLLAVAVGRYGPSWASAPPAPGDATLRVSTWNMLAGRDAPNRVRAGVSSTDADLVAVEELYGEAVAALAEPTFQPRFRYRLLPPSGSRADIGLLSVYPVIESQLSSDPPMLRAVVELSSTQQVVVYVVHAPLGRFVRIGDLIVSVDLSVRDRAIARIRARIDVDLAENRSVIILGDLNTTERELAYGVLSAGLRDAHLDAGFGPGLSWRPGPLSALPFGLLRIDYVLTTNDLQATSATVDCSMPSDHCRLDAGLNVGGPISRD
jgi:endonuclease/exonuclease/phosphatase (EEP) superfamily protein YafD